MHRRSAKQIAMIQFSSPVDDIQIMAILYKRRNYLIVTFLLRLTTPDSELIHC